MECLVHGDGSMEGGTLRLSFPAHWGCPDPFASTDWVVDMDRAEIERLTTRVDVDGWVVPGY